MKRFFFFLALGLFAVPSSAWAMSFDEALKDPSPKSHYFIYLHDETLETPTSVNATKYGEYDYEGIQDTFEKFGFKVIADQRPRVSALQYAGSLVRKLRRLMSKGVPSVHITMAGFGRGGLIALYVASALGDPYMNYVIMAGCGSNRAEYQLFVRRKRGRRLRGRILSILDFSDLESRGCGEVFEQAGNNIQSQEMRLRTGKGHALFYRPNPMWVHPVAQWALQQ